MKNENSAKTVSNVSVRVRLIAVMAILAAASVILGKLLQIPIGNSLRISLENLPVIFAGIFFGPASGAAVGAVADLVGCVAVGYTINPIITLGAAACGFTAGLIGGFTIKEQKPGIWRILLPVFAAHVIGSMFIKSVGLRLAYTTPWSVLALRIPTYIVNIAVESVIIYVLMKSEAIRSALKGFSPKISK